MAHDASHAKNPRADVNAGRVLSHALEALGEALAADPELPPRHRRHADALAAGRSVVPADGERRDFPGRVRGALAAPATEGVRALEAWLGDDLAGWLERTCAAAPAGPLAEAVVHTLEAREALLARKRPIAAVYARWHGEGLGDDGRAAFSAASELALGEAVDRWVALGCEGNLDRIVATWQRSSVGWAEGVLGVAVAVSTGDLGHLRALQRAVQGVRATSPETLARTVAKRLGVPEDEARRLLALDATVRARRDPTEVLRRRWAMIKPIAVAVAALEQELGRMPSVTEIAARAEVHPCAVDLVLEAMGGATDDDDEEGGAP